MTKKNNPHVHAKLIKAWADGAEIQRKDSDGNWLYIAAPLWGADAVYRIKPEPKKVEVHLYHVRNSNKGSFTTKHGERFSKHTEALYYEHLGTHIFEVTE